jgi:hypothetical protein
MLNHIRAMIERIKARWHQRRQGQAVPVVQAAAPSTVQPAVQPAVQPTLQRGVPVTRTIQLAGYPVQVTSIDYIVVKLDDGGQFRVV